MEEKDLGLKPILAKFRQAEMIAARVITLLHKVRVNTTKIAIINDS